MDYKVSWGGIIEVVQECDENKEELVKLQNNIDKLRKMEEIRNSSKNYNEIYDIILTFTEIEILYLNSPLLDELCKVFKNYNKEAKSQLEIYTDMLLCTGNEHENIFWALQDIESPFLTACKNNYQSAIKFLLPCTKAPLAGISKIIDSPRICFPLVKELVQYVLAKSNISIYFIQKALTSSNTYLQFAEAVEILKLCFKEKSPDWNITLFFVNALENKHTRIEVILYILYISLVDLEYLSDTSALFLRAETNEELKKYLVENNIFLQN